MTSKRRWIEGGGVLTLVAAAAYFLWVSWRKWPDPLIDFGRELYLPWRLSHGAVLYRDVDDFYGPLSQYLNAGLFSVFGPGLMVLVAANLAVFAGIVATLYAILRKAWGALAAWGGSAVFIAIFAFGQYVNGNFTYTAPYSHEATHGILVCLLLTHCLIGWTERPAVAKTALAGFLLGLAALLKPEILLAAAAVTGAALAVAWRNGRRPSGAAIGAGLAAAAGPSLLFTLYFWTKVPLGAALGMAGRAWLSALASSRFTGETVQTGFLGFDAPGPHAWQHLVATVLALALLGGIVAAARLAEKAGALWQRVGLAAAATGLVAWLAMTRISWPNSGKCLLGVALAVAAWAAAGVVRRRPDASAARLLVAILATVLLARMLLNGRIYQFGFYQAALAGVVAVAALLGCADRMQSAWGRWQLLAGTAALILPAVLLFAGMSARLYALKTFPVADGRDQFYAFAQDRDPMGAIVNLLRTRLSQTAESDTVLVLPEGEMINYLARRPSPVAPFFFFSAALSGGREEALVRQLGAHPPTWVVIVSRDLREYGIQRYGEAPGKGALLMRWVDAHYRLQGRAGGDPLDATERGAVLLGRRD